jgi:hypothetical protein
MTDARHAVTQPGIEPSPAQRRWTTTLGITAIGALLLAVMLLARFGVVPSLGVVLLTWLAAYLVARQRGSAQATSLIAALPLILIASVVVWILILYGGAGG